MSNEVEELRTLTVQQLASATGIQVWRLRQMIAEGKGPPHFRTGRVIRVKVSAAKQWMNEQTNQAKENEQ